MDTQKVVTVYPNPTTGTIYIEGAEPDVKIRDTSGRLLINRVLSNGKVDVSDLPVGFYIMSVISDHQEKSISISIVKQ
jgi:hypothetical protein